MRLRSPGILEDEKPRPPQERPRRERREGTDPGLKLYEKIDDIQLKLGGAICTVDAVFFKRREAAGENLDIFVFRTSRNNDGLDPEPLAKVNAYIQGHFEQVVRTMIRAAYDEEIARKQVSRRSTLPGLDAKGPPPP